MLSQAWGVLGRLGRLSPAKVAAISSQTEKIELEEGTQKPRPEGHDP